MNVMWWSLLVLAALLNALSQLALKRGVASLGSAFSWRHLPQLAINPWVIAGLAMQLVAIACWTLVLARTPLSVALPLLIGLLFFFVLCGSVVFFSESLSAIKLLGVALIWVGIAVLGLQAK